MQIKYRVINKRTGDDITNDYCWVIRPDGRLCYNDYGDLIGLDVAEAIAVDAVVGEIPNKVFFNELDKIMTEFFNGFIDDKELFIRINMLKKNYQGAKDEIKTRH